MCRVLFFCKFSKTSMNFMEQILFLHLRPNRTNFHFSNFCQNSKLASFGELKRVSLLFICSIDYFYKKPRINLGFFILHFFLLSFSFRRSSINTIFLIAYRILVTLFLKIYIIIYRFIANITYYMKNIFILNSLKIK